MKETSYRHIIKKKSKGEIHNDKSEFEIFSMLRKWFRFQPDGSDALEKVLKKNNIKPGKVHHCPLSEGKSSAVQYDVLVCAQNFANMFEDAKAKGVVVIPLKNVMSAPEIETKLKENGIL